MKLGCTFRGISLLLATVACNGQLSADANRRPDVATAGFAEIVSVVVTGDDAQNATFSVGVASPDIDCGQYANWWELIKEDGTLVHRRILVHSHVPPRFQNPFERSASGIALNRDTPIYIRAHMNNTGYGTQAFHGTVADGFVEVQLEAGRFIGVEDEAPQPGECQF